MAAVWSFIAGMLLGGATAIFFCAPLSWRRKMHIMSRATGTGTEKGSSRERSEMNRLINADELLARAEHEANGMTGDFKDLLVPTLSWLINKTSTAYDVDRVVEELVKSAKESHGNAGMGGEMVVNLDDAVEIFKQGGGGTDYVCEWKIDDTDFWNTSCRSEVDNMINEDKSVADYISHSKFNYCPYCGKKIKVVE